MWAAFVLKVYPWHSVLEYTSWTVVIHKILVSKEHCAGSATKFLM